MVVLVGSTSRGGRPPPPPPPPLLLPPPWPPPQKNVPACCVWCRCDQHDVCGSYSRIIPVFPPPPSTIHPHNTPVSARLASSSRWMACIASCDSPPAPAPAPRKRLRAPPVL